jgi:hypothetical protein
VDVIGQIDKRPNLLELTPKEFEHFVHNLFDLMGFDTKIFKADGDGSVVEAAWHHRRDYRNPAATMRARWSLASPAATARGNAGKIARVPRSGPWRFAPDRSHTSSPVPRGPAVDRPMHDIASTRAEATSW